MSDQRISDIPSIQEALRLAKGAKALKKMMPILRPVYKLLGADVDKIEGGLANVDEIEKMMQALAELPDRFNTLFAKRGWIAHGDLNVDAAKAAIGKGESGDLDGAEQLLVDYYSVETVHFGLMRMNAVKAFRPRMPLAQKAFIDYQEERYHACVPVILALMDGMVNDLNQRRGMFASGTTLEAWDSVAAHSTGLGQLVKLMTRMRQTTETEQIAIPYRNGILHGLDLGYDNKMVAAKTWAALFAVREWAIKAEQGQLTAPPPKPKKTFGALLKESQEIHQAKKRLNEWKPRTIVIGETVPSTGNPDEYEAGTPERALVEFLACWKQRNYGRMPTYSSHLTNYPANVFPKRMRDQFDAKRLSHFELRSIEDHASAVTEIDVLLVYVEKGEEIKREMRFRLLYEGAVGEICDRGNPKGSWKVLNWTAI
jgi:hypothetical protein